jgi:hypothetical protein
VFSQSGNLCIRAQFRTSAWRHHTEEYIYSRPAGAQSSSSADAVWTQGVPKKKKDEWSCLAGVFHRSVLVMCCHAIFIFTLLVIEEANWRGEQPQNPVNSTNSRCGYCCVSVAYKPRFLHSHFRHQILSPKLFLSFCTHCASANTFITMEFINQLFTNANSEEFEGAPMDNDGTGSGGNNYCVVA